MRTTNIRELRHATATVLEWVKQGETVQITRRNKVVAVISPPIETEPEKIVRHDYAKRLKEIFGDEISASTGTELMEYDRGDR